MTRVNTQMKHWSWGEFEFEWTVVGPFTAGYTAGDCGRCNLLTCGADDKNVLGAAAAEREGVDVNMYDFQMYWQHSCNTWGMAGKAYIGNTIGLMNGGGSIDGTAGTLAHEFGHNCKPAMPARMAPVTLRAFYLSCHL